MIEVAYDPKSKGDVIRTGILLAVMLALGCFLIDLSFDLLVEADEKGRQVGYMGLVVAPIGVFSILLGFLSDLRNYKRGVFGK